MGDSPSAPRLPRPGCNAASAAPQTPPRPQHRTWHNRCFNPDHHHQRDSQRRDQEPAHLGASIVVPGEQQRSRSEVGRHGEGGAHRQTAPFRDGHPGTDRAYPLRPGDSRDRAAGVHIAQGRDETGRCRRPAIRNRPSGGSHPARRARPVPPVPAETAPAKPAPPSPAPPPPPPATSAPQPAGCYPRASSGNCYQPGEFCPHADAGMTGVAGDGEKIICTDNDGLRWEPI